jgi:hypothetical protein
VVDRTCPLRVALALADGSPSFMAELDDFDTEKGEVLHDQVGGACVCVRACACVHVRVRACACVHVCVCGVLLCVRHRASPCVLVRACMRT